MRIAIEGMDGVGKTIISKMLADKLDYQYIDKPFKFLFSKLNLSEADIKTLEWKLYETYDEALITLFYGMGLLYGTRCNSNKDIVYDRHFVSNYYWHGNEETDSLHAELINLCGKPDLTVLLTASVSTRIKRIYERNNQDLDLSNSAMYDDGTSKMLEFLQNNKFNYIVVDTEKLLPDEIVDIIMEYVKKNKLKQLVKGDVKK